MVHYIDHKQQPHLALGSLITHTMPISKLKTNRPFPPSSDPSAIAGPSSSRPFARYEADSDKDDEELELEETLFGKKRKRVGAVGLKGKGSGKGKGKGQMPGVEWTVDSAGINGQADREEDDAMGDFADDQVRTYTYKLSRLM